jgi:hypothetical protein
MNVAKRGAQMAPQSISPEQDLGEPPMLPGGFEAEIPSMLSDLSRVRIADHALFVDAIGEDRKAWNYSFPFIYLNGCTGRKWIYLFEQVAGSIILYDLRKRDRGPELSLVLPPFPLTDEALKRAEERTRAFNFSGRWRIRSVQESDVRLLAERNLTISFKESEYIYDTAAVLAAEGPEFSRLRAAVSRARRHGAVQTRVYTAEDQPACQVIVEKWKRRLQEAGMRPDGYRSTTHCLAVAGYFPPSLLSGHVVEVDGQIHGFGFAGAINQSCGNLFAGMTDNRFRGLPSLLRVSVMGEFAHLGRFNDATDSGRDGLREQKQQFRPVEMHDIYQARSS